MKYERDDVNLPPHGQPPAQNEWRFLCIECKTLTPHDTLVSLGARCERCYEAYCRRPFTRMPRSVRPAP